MLKWCLLQDEKMDVKHKLLLYNNLRETLIIRVFAPDGESVRKYSFIFGVEQETLTEKSESGYNLKVARFV